MSFGCFRDSLKIKSRDVFGKRKGSDLTSHTRVIRWTLIIIIIII